MCLKRFILALAFTLAPAAWGWADVFRWDNGQLIPGTAGITPGPGVQLDHLDLKYASIGVPDLDLAGAHFEFSKLNHAYLQYSNLHNANLSSSNLTDAKLDSAVLTGANLSGAILVNASLYRVVLADANLSGANLSHANIGGSQFHNANLSGAIVTGADFSYSYLNGFTKEQLYSTASYQAKNLQAMGFINSDLSGWDLSGQNLTDANFNYATLVGINLSAANLTNVKVAYARLENSNLSGANLTGASFEATELSQVNLSGATITGARFGGTTYRGFTKEHLYSTVNYQAKSLSGVYLDGNDLDGWDFALQNLAGAHLDSSDLIDANLSGANLTGADLSSTRLTNANLSGAIITDANLSRLGYRTFTPEQLYSTASYQQKNLHGVGLAGYELDGWDFSGQNLVGADLHYSTLTNTNLSGANLTKADLHGSKLAGANLTAAGVSGADFSSAVDFTKEQLYSTASYQNKDLVGVKLTSLNVSGWDFNAQNLTDAVLTAATLDGANLSGANLSNANLHASSLQSTNLSGANLTNAQLRTATLTHANLGGANLTKAALDSANLTDVNLSGATLASANLKDTTARGFTKQQLYSTYSYQIKELSGIGLSFNDLSGWDLGGQNLSGAGLDFSTLADVNLTGAIVTSATFGYTTPSGFTKEQLYSTASYQAQDLSGIWLAGNDLSDWNLSGQKLTGAVLGHQSNLTNTDFSNANLTNASFESATLTQANLSGATVSGVNFTFTTPSGFTKEQLYSTASYEQKQLPGVVMIQNDLSGWDLSGQNLSNAMMQYATLANTNLSGAVVSGVNFYDTTSRGFTKEQLYATASYRDKDLQSIGLGANDLSGWDFNGQNLTNAYFFSDFGNPSSVAGADLSGADTRGALMPYYFATLRNTILSDGAIAGLTLAEHEKLVVRNYHGNPNAYNSQSPTPIPIIVNEHAVIAAGGVLQIRLDADLWESTISFEHDINVDLHGDLELIFADGVDPKSQLGRRFDVFDWWGVNRVDDFRIVSPYVWDLRHLYTSGEIKLLSVPAPPFPGDANGDRTVNFTDLGILLDHYNQAGAFDAGDFDGSGTVDFTDLGLLLNNYNQAAPLAAASAAVPEPSSLLLGCLGLVTVGIARRRAVRILG